MPTSKVCPICGNTDLVHIGSQNIKLCPDHSEHDIPWHVEDGEPAVFGGTTPQQIKDAE